MRHIKAIVAAARVHTRIDGDRCVFASSQCLRAFALDVLARLGEAQSSNDRAESRAVRDNVDVAMAQLAQGGMPCMLRLEHAKSALLYLQVRAVNVRTWVYLESRILEGVRPGRPTITMARGQSRMCTDVVAADPAEATTDVVVHDEVSSSSASGNSSFEKISMPRISLPPVHGLTDAGHLGRTRSAGQASQRCRSTLKPNSIASTRTLFVD